MVCPRVEHQTDTRERTGYESIFRLSRTTGVGQGIARLTRRFTETLQQIWPRMSSSMDLNRDGDDHDVPLNRDIMVKVTISQPASFIEGVDESRTQSHSPSDASRSSSMGDPNEELEDEEKSDPVLEEFDALQDRRIVELENAIAAAAERCGYLQGRIDVVNAQNKTLRDNARRNGLL